MGGHCSRLYLILMWSAYRWAIRQREPEGNIFARIEHEGIRRLAEERRRRRRSAPTFRLPLIPAERSCVVVAARYDRTHVVFVVAADRSRDSRLGRSTTFRNSPPGSPRRHSLLRRWLRLQELYEPDSISASFRRSFNRRKRAAVTLNLSPDHRYSGGHRRPVICAYGCSLAPGFLPQSLLTSNCFSATGREYFSVRRIPVESVDSRSILI